MSPTDPVAVGEAAGCRVAKATGLPVERVRAALAGITSDTPTVVAASCKLALAPGGLDAAECLRLWAQGPLPADA